MATLTERLEIRLPRSTAAMLRDEAKRRGVPVGQIVRESIEHALTNREARKRAVEELCAMETEVTDWEQMEREIIDGAMGITKEARADK